MLCAAVARGVSSQVQALKRFRAPASGSPFVAEDVTDKDFMLCQTHDKRLFWQQVAELFPQHVAQLIFSSK